MTPRFYYFLLLLLSPSLLKAQINTELNASEIKLGLEGLRVTGSVLYIAAHPDDENTRLLAYLAKERKVRTGYLSLTRGDGGQNLIGNEQAELLGLIRTHELLAARKIDGAEQFFTRANDFGFSKTAEESFKIWDKEKVLSDMVWVIRSFQPDVIITRFPPDARAGHGHHAGSAILAHEAFNAAADPNRFPEQLKTVKVWKAKRLLWNTFNFGGNNTTSEDQLKIDVGSYNPLLGKSYGEIAAESRSKHRSQGFGSALQRGSATEYFSHVAGIRAESDLFDGVNLHLYKNSDMVEADQILDDVNSAFDLTDPSYSLPKLLELKKVVNGKPFKHKELDRLILACAGIWFEAQANRPAYALGEDVPTRIQAISRVKQDFGLPVNLKEKVTSTSLTLSPNKFITADRRFRADAAVITQPYWLRKKHPIGMYAIDNNALIGMPEESPRLFADFVISIGDTDIAIKEPVIYKFTDPSRGEIYQQVVVAPPVTATISEQSVMFEGNKPKNVVVQLKSFKKDSRGVLEPVLPEGWKTSPSKIDFTLPEVGDEQTVSFNINPSGRTEEGTIRMQTTIEGKKYSKGLRVISYDHIPVQTLFPEAEAVAKKLDLKIAGKKIGYVEGAGDLVAQSLTQIGYDVTVLSPEQVINNDLSGFDAIVTGVRLYNVSGKISAMQPKLLDYVEGGGTLVVQYNVSSGLKLDKIGPYHFKLSRDRVTEENAKVSFLDEKHPVLNSPNKIAATDFDNWVQERGLYFLSDLDPKYTPLLSMGDTGDQQSNGSLVIADYGKGKFVYTSISFFRQLPAGVKGAYRLFVNLLSAGSSK